MPLPVYAIWFPDTRTVLISRNDAGAPDLFDECESIDRLGPRASGARRRDWELPQQGIMRATANPHSKYDIYNSGDGPGIRLTLDAEVRDGALLLVSYANGNSRQIRFLTNAANWSDAAELHGYARQMLRLEQQEHIEAIWCSPMSVANEEIRLGPARAVWPCGTPRRVEILPLEKSSGPFSKLELVARTDRLAAQSGGRLMISHLSPVSEVILLVWRSIIAGRLNSTAPSAFLQAFQHNTSKYLGWSIAFDRIRATPSARRPIARGYFVPRSDTPLSRFAPGERVSWQFEGPLDINDVLILCVPLSPERPLAIVRQQGPSHDVLTLEPEGSQFKAFCWRAELDHLVPVAWTDIEQEIQTSLLGQIKDELQTTRKPADQAGIPSAAAAAADPDPAVLPETAEADATAAAQRGAAVEHSAVFEIEAALSGTVEEWFATLSVETVGKLYAGRKPDSRHRITSIARFLPIDVAGLLDAPANWAVFEDDAEALYERLIGIQRILGPSTTLAGRHLRSDAGLWKSIGHAAGVLQSADEAMITAALQPFAANSSGSLALLNPVTFRSTSVALSRLEKQLKQLSTEAAAEESAPDHRPSA
jgi:hypothetical protein